MNIGVLGYYGYGNVGDDTILEVMREFLQPHNVTPIQTGFVADNETIQRLNEFDFLILGGGGLFNNSPTSPFDTFDQWAKYLEPPMGVLGVGVKKIDPLYSHSINALVDCSRFFIVRDRESYSLIDHPKVQLAPDLTFYRPQRVCPYAMLAADQVICGVNLRPSRSGLEEWVKSIVSLPCSRRAIPFSVVPAFDDREPLSYLDVNCPEKFDIQAYFGLDVFLGVAFHSIVFAVQNGIPSLAINYHPKVKRLMDDIDLSDCVLDWNNHAGLENSYWWLLDNHRSIREKMLDYTDRSHREIVAKLSLVRDEIDAHHKSAYTTSHKKDAYPKTTVVINNEISDTSLIETIQSCVVQVTYSNLDVIVITYPNMPDVKLPDSLKHKVSKIIVKTDEKDWVKIALDAADGEYLMWLNSGEYLAQDAVGLMMKLISENGHVDLVYSDYYLTQDRIIERKVNPRNNPFESCRAPYGSCFLVNRQYALGLRTLQLEGKTLFNTKHMRELYIAHGLLFRPARDEEISLYRSALLFGYGKTENGKKFLEKALQKVLPLRDNRAELEKIFDFFWNTPFEITYYINPETLMELVYDNFPGDGIQMRILRNRFRARILIARAFSMYRQGIIDRTGHLLLDAVVKDPRWLMNRGVLSLLGKSLLHLKFGK